MDGEGTALQLQSPLREDEMTGQSEASHRGRLRQAHLLEANLGYIAIPYWVFMSHTHIPFASPCFPRVSACPQTLWIAGMCYHAYFM